MSEHGTPSRYNNQGCRCDECREANRLWHAAYMARVRTQPLDAADPRHGSSIAYQYGCHCELCTTAHNDAKRRYRESRRERGLPIVRYYGQALDENDPRHGTRKGYNYHLCRCDRCRAAWAKYGRDKRQRKRAA